MTEIQLNCGQAYVLSKPIHRGMLRALHWISPPAYPFTVVETRVEAIRWARERLAERGVSPGSSKAS